MAIILEAAYSKKLGLPNFSSHSFVVSICAELSDLSQVKAESARLYTLLQQSVDNQIQQVGFLPDGITYGMHAAPASTYPNENGDGAQHNPAPTPLHQQEPSDDQWSCSDKQKELILSLVEQHHLDKQAVEALAKELFGLRAKTLNRLQASGLIEELLVRHGRQDTHGSGKARPNGGTGYRRPPAEARP